uniref:Variant surface glycoprotein Mul 3 n=1 Tax=Trypanosoma brucei brucei TaxID=5702 RepID=Q571W6_TRYBB|nr:variant surface glycoprotein Mul 3 [Trypanosoma brucei brucei]
MNKKILILTVFALAAGKNKIQATDELPNAPDFAVLCRIVQHAKAGFKQASEDEKSVASQLAATTAKLAIINDDDETRYLDKNNRTIYRITGDEPKIPKGAEKKPLKAKLLQLERRAAELKNDYDNTFAEATRQIEQANDELAEAVYGAGAKFEDQGDSSKLITNARASSLFGATGTYNKNCGGTNGGGAASTSNVGITLVSDIYCLCIAGTASAKTCDQTTTALSHGTLFASTAGTGKEAFDALMAKCGSQPQQTSPSELHALLIAWQSKLGSHFESTNTRDAARFIIGRADNPATGCTGAAKQHCVDYKSFLGATPSQDPRWVSKIKSAITKVQTAAEKSLRLRHSLSLLEVVSDQANLTYTEGLNSQRTQRHNAENNAPTKQTETDETCEKKGTGDGCKDGCKWDGEGDNKKCVKDLDYKPKQAEGGEKESKTGTTNTTGSNSFIINKGPLLLTFLLF